MTRIIIPIKALSAAKSRLAAVLSAEQRAGLVLSMLDDVLLALLPLQGCRVCVVACDQAVCDLAGQHGVDILREDHSSGYNAAVQFALAGLEAGSPVAVVPGDVPLATTAELRKLTASPPGKQPLVRLVASSNGQGTNGLFMSCSDLLKPAFGPGSFTRYRDAAASAGLAVELLELPGLAQDIDHPDDLHQLQPEPVRMRKAVAQ